MDIDIDEVRYFMWSAINGILNTCGNSYSNSWCEHLLSIAKKYNAYTGRTIGSIQELKDHIDDNQKLNEEMITLGDKLFNTFFDRRVNHV